MTTVRTESVYPPIPIRFYDWCARTDDYDGADDSMHQLVGSGRTEFYAVLDLYNNWDDMNWPEPFVAHRPMFMEDILC